MFAKQTSFASLLVAVILTNQVMATALRRGSPAACEGKNEGNLCSYTDNNGINHPGRCDEVDGCLECISFLLPPIPVSTLSTITPAATASLGRRRDPNLSACHGKDVGKACKYTSSTGITVPGKCEEEDGELTCQADGVLPPPPPSSSRRGLPEVAVSCKGLEPGHLCAIKGTNEIGECEEVHGHLICL